MKSFVVFNILCAIIVIASAAPYLIEIPDHHIVVRSAQSVFGIPGLANAGQQLVGFGQQQLFGTPHFGHQQFRPQQFSNSQSNAIAQSTSQGFGGPGGFGGGFGASQSSATANTQTYNQQGGGFGSSSQSGASANANSVSFNQGGYGGYHGYGGNFGQTQQQSTANANSQTQNFQRFPGGFGL